jgi:hypothetical protein
VFFNIPLQDPTKTERPHRIARQARHAAKLVSDAIAREARRRCVGKLRRRLSLVEFGAMSMSRDLTHVQPQWSILNPATCKRFPSRIEN